MQQLEDTVSQSNLFFINYSEGIS